MPDFWKYVLKMYEKPDVFISHASEEKEKYVIKLYELLRSYNINVFFDSENINGSDNFVQKINKALSESSVFVAIVSDHYLSKKWCQDELAAAIAFNNKKRIFILPYLLVDGETFIEKFPLLSSCSYMDGFSVDLENLIINIKMKLENKN